MELQIAVMREAAELIREGHVTKFGAEVSPLTEFSMPSFGRLYVTHEGNTVTMFIVTPHKPPPVSVDVIVLRGECETLPASGMALGTFKIRIRKIARRFAS